MEQFGGGHTNSAVRRLLQQVGEEGEQSVKAEFEGRKVRQREFKRAEWSVKPTDGPLSFLLLGRKEQVLEMGGNSRKKCKCQPRYSHTTLAFSGLKFFSILDSTSSQVFLILP